MMKIFTIVMSMLLLGTISTAYAKELTYDDCLMNVPQMSHMTYDQCVKKIKPIIVEKTSKEKELELKAQNQLKYDQCIKNIPKTATTIEKAAMNKKCKTELGKYTIELASVTEYKARQKDKILVCERAYSSWVWLESHGIKIQSPYGQNKCAKLYKDPLWNYKGQDRYDKLIALYIKYWGR